MQNFCMHDSGIGVHRIFSWAWLIHHCLLVACCLKVGWGLFDLVGYNEDFDCVQRVLAFSWH